MSSELERCRQPGSWPGLFRYLGRDKWRRSQPDTGFSGLWFSSSLSSQISHCFEGKPSLTAAPGTPPS